jgi:hypothetical protein
MSVRSFPLSELVSSFLISLRIGCLHSQEIRRTSIFVFVQRIYDDFLRDICVPLDSVVSTFRLLGWPINSLGVFSNQTSRQKLSIGSKATTTSSLI